MLLNIFLIYAFVGIVGMAIAFHLHTKHLLNSEKANKYEIPKGIYQWWKYYTSRLWAFSGKENVRYVYSIFLLLLISSLIGIPSILFIMSTSLWLEIKLIYLKVKLWYKKRQLKRYLKSFNSN